MKRYNQNERIPFTHDYIKADLPVYSFAMYDIKKGLYLGDESFTIILNTKCSPEKVPDHLKSLFEYINDPVAGLKSDDALIGDIDRQVSRFNTDEWRRKHMTIQELMDRNYEQGRAEGEAAGRELGRAAAIMELARSMKAKGRPIIQISEDTGLTADEIEKL